MNAIAGCIHRGQESVLRFFYSYGHFLARHPAWFIVVPVAVCGALALGFLTVDPISDTESLYAPQDTRAISDRELMEATFPDQSGTNFHPFSVNRVTPKAEVIFRSIRPNSVLEGDELGEVRDFYTEVVSISITHEDNRYDYQDLCAKSNGSCMVSGGVVLQPSFPVDLAMGNVTYPLWTVQGEIVDMRRIVSDVSSSSAGVLSSAGALKMTFPLRSDTDEMKELSLKWESQFIELISGYNLTHLEVVYSASESLSLELDRTTSGDVKYFAMTFTLMITYASIASTGGDAVSTRALLAGAGVMAVLVGIMGAFGLVSMSGVRFVNIVSVMPFLTLGIGVDDMFLMMSAWSETLALPELTVPERIGTAFKKAGVGIIITSVTDFLAFMVGYTSEFVSVQNFCMYSGVGVMLCFLCNATAFGACLTLHGRRVFARRHTITCRPVYRSREEMLEDGESCCFALACGGQVPASPSQDQSPCERGPKAVLIRVLMLKPVRVLILLAFGAYLAIAVWGCTKLKQGLDTKDLLLEDSYLYKYRIWEDENFPMRLPVSFVYVGEKSYSTPEALQDIREVLDTAKTYDFMDDLIERCWLTSLASSGFYNTTSDAAFISGLKLFLQQQPSFGNDVVFDATNSTVMASRCHVSTLELLNSTVKGDMMVKMREVADTSGAGVFAYCRLFVMYEQFVIILRSTLQTVGQTVLVMLVVTILFLPHPVIVLLVMLQVTMIIVGVFGFMAHWGLTLSAITMIHLIMSVGFSVDFCAHVCTAYMVSSETGRKSRALDSVTHASGPILNGGFSSMIGVLVLVFSKSYIFTSFFKVMLLVIGFGVLHAIFLIPVLLSFIGPKGTMRLENGNEATSTPPPPTTPARESRKASAESIPKRTPSTRKVGPIEINTSNNHTDSHSGQNGLTRDLHEEIPVESPVRVNGKKAD